MLVHLLWDQAVLQRDLAQAELERARARSERVLQRAPASAAAFAAVPAALRVVVRADGEPETADVAWLEPLASPLDVDLVVDDRLARATQAEFADHDLAAAERGHAELLAVPLVAPVRLRVLVAAAWQARRAGAVERVAALRRELDVELTKLAPADLARRALAESVAGALRLAASAPLPPWAATLAPFLPPELFAGLPDASPWAGAHAELVQRRQLLVRTRAALRAVAANAPVGVAAVDEQQLVWWQPREGGGRDAALLTPRQWALAVDDACRRGELPDASLPCVSLVATSTRESFAGVPGFHDAAFRRQFVVDWGPACLTGTLVLVLAVALAASVAAQLRLARAEMRAVRTQSEFLTTVTHELKTPLASIRLLGEMLADGRARGREADYYQMLAGEAGRLSMLIENVLDLGRLERGERAQDLRAVDVGEVVGETLAMFAPLAERDRGRVVSYDLCGSVAVRVDRGALVQALVAVLDNARKYGGAGMRIDVVTRRTDERVAIDVRDRGPGVPAAERDRIFERFVRGHAHAHGSTPGVGIGLYLARSLARSFGGELVCADPLDGGPGACFTFFLPVETSA